MSIGWAIVTVLVAAAAFAIIGANRLFPLTTVAFLERLSARRARLIEKRVTCDGHTLVYFEGGNPAGETLVLVHGLGAEKGSFLAIAEPLGKRYRLIIPDLLGFGRSDKPADADYGIDATIESLYHFLQPLAPEPVHIGGSSMGGWVSAAYAARFPEHVASLWLISTAGTNDMRQSEVILAYQQRHEYLLFAKTWRDFYTVARMILHRPNTLPYCVVRALGERSAANYRLHTAIFDDLVARGEQFQLEPRLPLITAPTLITGGANDRVVPPSALDTLHRGIRHSRKILLPHCGHTPQAEAALRIVADYLAFRDGLRG